MKKKCSELKENEEGIIKNICLDERKKFRLLHLGAMPNAKIICKVKSPFGSPIAYQIHSCVFALRREDAERVEVEV